MYLKFKERSETEGIQVYTIPDELPLATLEKILKRKGWFSIGFNYILHTNGVLDVGIPQEQCADPSIDGWEKNICILAMGAHAKKMSTEQLDVLKKLSSELDLLCMVNEATTWHLK